MNASASARLAMPLLVAALLVALWAPRVDALMLAWDPSPSPDVAGYELHVGYASGDYEYSIDVGPATAWPLPPLAAGRTHYLAVKAYDATGARSGTSNEIVVPHELADAQPLAADFIAFPLVGVAPHTVRFTPVASGGLLAYRWDFGDGNAYVPEAPAPLPNMPYTYERPGTYSVTFTVSGPNGVQVRHRTAMIRVMDGADSDGCPCSLWGSAAPRRADDTSDRPVNVGMRFATARDGYVTAVRFYKSPANAGPHVGNLWTEHGEPLGSVAFAGETASGWQQADFATPVPVRAHAVYVVSYHAPHGHVARDDGAFLKEVEAGPVYAPASRASAPNGVHTFGPPATFPRGGDKQSNHWVDVVFVPGD